MYIVKAGVHGLTVHPRPDQRHVKPEDVFELRQLAKREGVEFNIEGNPSLGTQNNGYPGFSYLVSETQPEQCTLVPDSDSQLTSDHGWDLVDHETFEKVSTYVNRYRDAGIRTSIFLDADTEQIQKAHETGADRIELFTGPYAECAINHGTDSSETRTMLKHYQKCTNLARQLGLGVNAGHDLNLDNLTEFCSIGGIAEVSIGHALIADALKMGLVNTVHKYLQAISKATFV